MAHIPSKMSHQLVKHALHKATVAMPLLCPPVVPQAITVQRQVSFVCSVPQVIIVPIAVPPVLCPSSTYAGNASVQCLSCPAGSYCPVEGLPVHYPCQPGHFSNSTGAIQCSMCPAGHSCVDASATPSLCPRGNICCNNRFRIMYWLPCRYVM